MNEDIGLLFGIFALFFGCCFGTYKLGRYLERKDLTGYFVEMTTKTYWDGYADGVKNATKAY